MRATVGKAFKFEAAHVIPWHKNPDGSPGKCSNLHGHSYSGMAYLRGEVDERGWLKDFHLMAADMKFIDGFDHTFLNSRGRFCTVPGSPTYWPTTEHVAAAILTALQHRDERYVRVVLRETGSSEVVVESGDLE